jgi:hypothetical protein
MKNLSQAFLTDIENTIRSCPAGLSEFELIKRLRAVRDNFPFLVTTGNRLALFRCHFLLFHSLYLLQTRLWKQEAGHLEISPLCITLVPYQPGVSGLCQPDPLRDYYLDPQNLETTSEEDVESMLNAFWNRYRDPNGRRAALRTLDLEDPVNDTEIKRRYRKLAMQHHPDRGGDTLALQTINAAIRILLPGHDNSSG